MQFVWAMRTAPKKPFCIFEILFICLNWRENDLENRQWNDWLALWQWSTLFRLIFVWPQTQILRRDEFVEEDQLIHSAVQTIVAERVPQLDAMRFVTKYKSIFLLSIQIWWKFTFSISCKARLNCFSWSIAELRRFRNWSASSWNEKFDHWNKKIFSIFSLSDFCSLNFS